MSLFRGHSDGVMCILHIVPQMVLELAIHVVAVQSIENKGVYTIQLQWFKVKCPGIYLEIHVACAICTIHLYKYKNH